MSKPLVGEHNQRKLDEAVRLLKEVFPPMPRRDRMTPREYGAEQRARRFFIEQRLAPALLGRPSPWSRPEGYKLTQGHVFHSGGFCIYWGRDPDVPDIDPHTGKPTPEEEKIVALVHVRKEQDEQGRNKLGAPGGHLKRREQTFEGVRRETMEEICDNHGGAVIVPDPSRYVLLGGDRDFASKKTQPLQYAGFAYELSPDEVRALKTHIKKCEEAGYLSASVEASGQETHGLRLWPLIEIVGLAQSLTRKGQKPIERQDFTHTRQYSFYVEVANRLGIGPNPSKPSSQVGFTLGDLSELIKDKWTLDETRHQPRQR